VIFLSQDSSGLGTTYGRTETARLLRSLTLSPIGPCPKTVFRYHLSSAWSHFITGILPIMTQEADRFVILRNNSTVHQSRLTTQQLRDAFAALKIAITSDPCLARFDSTLPTFLKTDWSAAGMSYVLMQPSDDPSSKKALSILERGGPNTFDELMTGARLRPVRFGSRRCTDRERHFHSFVGEAVTGRWAIGQCRRYL
jgi:hypothetical protein